MTRYTRHATDVVGYTYQADTYCPRCTIEQLIADSLASPAARDMWHNGPETFAPALDQIATANAIDRMDEHSYDSDEFPKVIFASQLEDEEYCGNCGGAL